MKKQLMFFAAVMVISLSARAQGTSAQITMDNYGLINYTTGATYNAPITGATPEVRAHLYLVGSGGTLTELNPTTTFRTGAASAYLVPLTIDVPGVAPGTSATFILRAWAGADYSTANIWGESSLFTVANLGGTPGDGTPPILPPKLNGMQTFSMNYFPEPTPIALATLGAFLFFIRRRI